MAILAAQITRLIADAEVTPFIMCWKIILVWGLLALFKKPSLVENWLFITTHISLSSTLGHTVVDVIC